MPPAPSPAALPTPHAFGAADWAVVAAYGLVVIAIGYHYSRRQRTTEEYFVGGRSMGPLLAGISIFTATSSIIAYVGTPGEYIQYGPVLVLFANLAPIPLVQILVAVFIIPAIMRIPITSAYELLEARLGGWVRRTASIIFIFTRFIWMALILYAGTGIVVGVTGCDPQWKPLIVVVMGAVTVTYTLIGGIRSVMITEVMQFFMLVAGALLTLASITWRLGGIGAWWPAHRESHWPATPIFTADPHVRVSYTIAFLYYTLAAICSAGSDQAAIQRLLTTRDAASARRAYLLSNLANGVMACLLAMVGAALLAFYRRTPIAASFTRQGDFFFPHYVSHYLPTGISGLLVACMLAAAMSCLAAGLNATVTVLARDFLGSLFWSGATETDNVRRSRWMTLILGVLVIGAGIAIGAMRGDLVELSGKTINLLFAPIFGLFFLAIFVPFATPFGAILGAVYSSTSAALIAFWDVFTGRPALSFLLIIPVSLAVSIAAGCGFSLVPARGKSWPVVAGLAGASLAALALGVAGLVR